VPGDPDIAGAMTAFQNYLSVGYTMETKVEHSNDLVKYADGNVLTLANNYITFERQNEFSEVGTQSVKVTNAAKDTGNPPVVSITVCTDSTKFVAITNYGPRKGMQADTPPTHPYPATYRVHKGADGKWRVNAVTAEPKTSC
jgi:hypothetical protein